MQSTAFTRFWQTDLTRECFLSYTAPDDLCSLRRVSRDFAEQVAHRLFARCKVIFNVNTLSRPSRMAALERIGCHVKHLEFNMPHSATTFLPPLLDPQTGSEQHFNYEPQSNSSPRPSSSSSSSSSSSYGSVEMTDLLIKQWPPLFHAATNISSFKRFVAAMPNLRHLHVSCPDQPSGQRYRRSCVDYVLISLRMALESVNLRKLTHLTLSPVHPSSVWYLRPAPLSTGSTPSSTRLWRRITHLDIAMDSAPHTRNARDHHKLAVSYLINFPSLTSLQFTWRGAEGPSPLSVHDDETVYNQDIQWSTPTLVASSTSIQPQPRFRRLKTLRLCNAKISAPSTSAFIAAHRKVLDEVDFTDCTVRDGSWDDALRPLTSSRQRSAHHFPPGEDRTSSSSIKHSGLQAMDVPIVFSQVIDTRTNNERIKHMLWDAPYTPAGTSRMAVLRKAVARSLRTDKDLSHHSRVDRGTGLDCVKNFFKYSVVKWH